MSFETEEKMLNVFMDDKKATYRFLNKGAWSISYKVKDYVLGYFSESKTITKCEVTMSNGRVLLIDVNVELLKETNN